MAPALRRARSGYLVPIADVGKRGVRFHGLSNGRPAAQTTAATTSKAGIVHDRGLARRRHARQFVRFAALVPVTAAVSNTLTSMRPRLRCPPRRFNGKNRKCLRRRLPV